MLWRMSAVMWTASHYHSSCSMVKLGLSGPGAFFCDWSNSALLTLVMSPLWWAVPSLCGGSPIASAGEGVGRGCSSGSFMSQRGRDL